MNYPNLLRIFFSLGLALAIFSSCSMTEETNLKPNILFKGLSEETQIREDSILQIEVQATDEDGTINKVEIWMDEQLLYQSDQAPYIFSWEPEIKDLGPHRLWAVAYDDKQENTTSSALQM